MNADVKNNVNSVIVLKPTSPTADQLASFLQAMKNVEILNVESAVELIQLANQMNPCIVLLTVADTQQVVNVVTALKGMHSLAKRGRVKTMVVSKVKNAQLRGMAQKLNVAEFIEEPIPAKTLQFKANLQMKALDAIKKRDAELLAQQQTIEIRKGEAAARQNDVYAPEAKLKPPVNLDADAFTFRGSKVRKTDNRTQFDLGGPDPASGEWKEHKSAEEGKTAWRWVPKDPAELEKIGGAQGKDGWVAEGDKPEFDALKKKWAMGGKAPSLSYMKDGRKEAVKAEVNAAGELEVAEDSPAAEEKVRKSLEAINKRAEAGAEKKKPEAAAEAKEAASAGDLKDKRDPKSAKDKLAGLRNRLGDDDDESAEPGAKKADEKKVGAEAEAKDPAAAKEKSDEGVEVGAKDAKTKKADKGSKEDALARLRKGLESDDDEETTSEDPALRDKRSKDKAADSEINDRIGDAKDPEAAKRDLRGASKEEIAGKKKGSGSSNEASAAEEPDGDADDKVGAAAAGGEKAAKKKGEKSGASAEDRLKALRDRLGSDDEEGAEHNDRSAQGEHGVEAEKRDLRKEKAEKIAAIQKEKKAIAQEIQAELNKPLPKKLNAEDRQKLEEEIGGPKDKLSDEDLAKAAKAARLKKLKKRLKDKDDLMDLDDLTDGADAKKLNVHDLSEEEKANTRSQQNLEFEEEKPKWQAQDSDQDSPEVQWNGHKKAAAAASATESVEDGRKVFYVPARDISVDEPAWARAKPYYVCVAAATSYRGFDSLQSLLPIWCYEGEEKPDLVDKDTRWRFYGAAPLYCRTIQEVPVEVKAYLTGLNEELKASKKQVANEEADKEREAAQEALNERKKKLEALKEKMKSQDDASPEEAAEAGKSRAELRKEREEKIQKEMDELSNEMAEISREEEAREEARIQAISKMQEERVEKEQEELRAAKEEKAKKQAEEDSNVKMDDLREKLEEQPKAAPVTEALESKIKNSEASDFLERRRARKEKAAAEADGIPPTEGVGRSAAKIEALHKEEAKQNPGVTRQFNLADAISISLLISDAMFESKSLVERPEGFLKTVKDRFGYVEVIWSAHESEGNGRVIGSTLNSAELGKVYPIALTDPGSLSSTDEGAGSKTKEIAIAMKDPRNGIALGYLQLVATEERKTFISSDYQILEAISAVFSEYWGVVNELSQKGGKAA